VTRPIQWSRRLASERIVMRNPNTARGENLETRLIVDFCGEVLEGGKNG